MSSAEEHGDQCVRPLRGKCLKFSTDGTRLGADIAHEFGTTDEKEIAYRTPPESEREFPLTGMPEEQADWDEGEDSVYDEAWRNRS